MTRLQTSWLVLVVFVAVAPATPGQCPPPTWSTVGSGFDGAVTALAVYDGRLIAGGGFTSADGVPARHVAAFNGSKWSALGAGVADPIRELAVLNGTLIAECGGLTAWTGSTWQPLPLPTAGMSIGTMTVHDGALFAGGSVTSSDPGHQGTIGVRARWNGTSWSVDAPMTMVVPTAVTSHGNDVTWALLDIVNHQTQISRGFMASAAGSLGSINGDVAVLATHGGELIAGGYFTAANGIPANRIAAWDGVDWHALGAGLDSGVRAITTFDGELIAGGAFTTAGGVPALRVAGWNGTSWHALDSGLTAPVATFQLFRAGLVVGGCACSSSISAGYLTRWSSPRPILEIVQASGPGTAMFITNCEMVPGHEYFNLYSTQLCGGDPGSGPLLGLCANDLTELLWQIGMPVGVKPFHFIAARTSASAGPFAVPPGLAFDGICLDVTGGGLGCVSPAIRFTVQ